MTIIKKQRHFAAAFFDLDDTLYRNQAMPNQVKHNIIDYVIKNIGFSPEEAEDKTVALYKEYGTTMAGLVAKGYSIDFDHWHREVHGTLDYDTYLNGDIRLRELLCSIELPRFVFTNSDRRHAETCLDKLGVADCFQETINFESLQQQASTETHKHPHMGLVQCKPNSTAFLLAMQQVGLQHTSPHDIIFFDDSTRNVTAAHRMGMFSVLIGHSSPPAGTECDLAVVSMMDLHTAAPWLFNNPSLAVDDTPAAAAAASGAILPGAFPVWRRSSACASEAEHHEQDDGEDPVLVECVDGRRSVDSVVVRG